jgi:hypothetical protein
MGTLLDGQAGAVKESTFGTAVTVTRFPEVLADSTHNFDPMRIDGNGLRVGSTVLRQARITPGVGKGDITLKVELTSKGLGMFFESICGSIAHTLVSGSTFQQRGLPTMTTPFRPSYTIQYGVPRSDASGTVDAYTYAGCTAVSFEIDAPERDIPTLSISYWASSLSVATGLASASYVTTPTLFVDGAGNAGTTLGGALTVPTTVALESGGTSATNIRSWKLTGDLKPNERPRLGGWQQPTFSAAPDYKLQIVQDYDATATRALQISQGATSFTGFYTGAALSSGTERFGIVVPSMALDDGALGQLTTGSGSLPNPTFTVTDNLTDAPWYLVTRTADAAL